MSGDVWQRAHAAAHTLREALTHIGIPEDESAALTARARPAQPDVPIVHVPPLSPESAELLTRALGPYLGPEFIGRVSLPPVAPPSRTS